MARILYPARHEPVLTADQRPEQVTESRWHQPFSEPVRFRRAPGYTVAIIASGAVISAWALTQAEAVTVDRWLQPLSIPQSLERPALPAHQQQATIYVAPVVQVENITVDKWHRPFNEPVRVPVSIQIGQQQALAFVQAAPFAETVSIDRWLRPLDEPQRQPPRLSTADQQAFAFVKADPFPESTDPGKWYRPFGEPVRFAPAVAFQQFAAFYSEPIPDVVAPVGYYSIYPDRALRNVLLTGDQQSFAFVKAAPFEETVSVDRWLQPLSEPRWSRQPVAFQQATALWPHPIPNLDAPVGVYAVYPDWAPRAVLLTADQQALAFVKAAPFPENVTPDKWYQPFVNPQRRSLSVTVQIAVAFWPYPIPPAPPAPTDELHHQPWINASIGMMFSR